MIFEKVLEIEKELEKQLQNNSTYQQLQAIREFLKKFPTMETIQTVKMESILDKSKLDKNVIIEEVEKYFETVHNKPSPLKHIVEVLANKGFLPHATPAITINGFLRTAEKFEYIRDNRTWKLRDFNNANVE